MDISLDESSHSPDVFALTQTRILAFGPIRIGLDSGTNTVRFPAIPQPVIDASTSALKSIWIRNSVHANRALR